MVLRVEFLDREDEVSSFTASTRATGYLQFPSPNEVETGATVFISDGTNEVTFEFTRGGGASPGNTEVNISATTTMLQVHQVFQTALNNSACNVTSRIQGQGTGVFLSLTNPARGSIGNVGIVVNNFNSPPIEARGMIGGSNEILSTSIITVQELPSIGKWAVWYDA